MKSENSHCLNFRYILASAPSIRRFDTIPFVFLHNHYAISINSFHYTFGYTLLYMVLISLCTMGKMAVKEYVGLPGYLPYCTPWQFCVCVCVLGC